MHILIAPNSFKECASAGTIARILDTEFRKSGYTQNVQFPLSDGGDGFLELCEHHLGVERHSLSIRNIHPFDYRHKIHFGYHPQLQTVYLESAEIIGLSKIPVRARHPLSYNSSPLGIVLRSILSQKKYSVKNIMIGIGGTGTNDLGLGLCSMFGLKLFDATNKTLPVVPMYFSDVRRIELPERISVPIEVALDVAVPLTGNNGPSLLFSPQKGATVQEAVAMERGVSHILAVLKRQHGMTMSEKQIGAGGGLTLGLMLLSHVSIVRSKELIIDNLHLATAMKQADVIVTGEGKFDRQSGFEKATGIVLQQAHRFKKQLFFIAGSANSADRKQLSPNVTMIELQNYFASPAASIRYYKRGLHLAVGAIVRDIISSRII